MPSFRDDKGFTVIEAVVASVILAVGMLGVGAMLQWSMMHDMSSVSARTGDSIAQEVAEQLKGEIANNVSAVVSLSNIQLNDPNFALVANNSPVPGCPGGVNCVEQYGTYRGLNYRWRVDDRPDPALDPTGLQWANTWRLRITVGWEDCPDPGGANCTDMGGGRYNRRSTQIVTFLVPTRP